jgi:tetratricopeptide (TPR) repeat protein
MASIRKKSGALKKGIGKELLILLLVFMPSPVFPAGFEYIEKLPEWYLPLREAIYDQILGADEVDALALNVKRTAEAELSGAELLVMLSRIEYCVGRAYQFEEQNKRAIPYYERGMALAEKALAENSSAGAYEMLAKNISQLCMLKPVTWTMANGLKVEQNAKKALVLNSRDGTSQFQIAARWVYGPGIFGDPARGIREMKAILEGGYDLQKDDIFNITSAIGYGYLRLKKKADARPWLEDAARVYPDNKYIKEQLHEAE